MSTEFLSPADLDRLEELLESEVFTEGAMRLDEAQALLCAVISGPVAVPAEDWLAEILGAGGEGGGEREEVETLLRRYHAELAAGLANDESVAAILYPVDESGEEDDYAAWADAYVYGCGLAGDWFELSGKYADDLAELLEPLFLLNGTLREDVEASGERWFSPAEEARVVGEVKEGLPDIIQALYDFWRSKEGIGTVRRDEPKVGRNDPCPCGSGRKFKQCCGRPDRLN